MKFTEYQQISLIHRVKTLHDIHTDSATAWHLLRAWSSCYSKVGFAKYYS